MKRLQILFVLFALMLATACVLQPELENMPEVGIPPENLNTKVRVIAPRGLNTYKINAPIQLVIYVMGDEAIIFSPDFGVKIFLYKDGEWTEVVETVPITYLHGDTILPPSQGNSFLSGSARAFPLFPGADHPVLLRIFVLGHVYRDATATDEKVGAYVDVILHP